MMKKAAMMVHGLFSGCAERVAGRLPEQYDRLFGDLITGKHES